MANYITSFSSITAYDEAKNSLDYPNVSLIENDSSLVYEKTYAPTPSYSAQYLTFVAQEDGQFMIDEYAPDDYIQYSLDSGTTWVELAKDTYSPTVSSGNTIMWKAEYEPGSDGCGTFKSTGNFIVEGNVTLHNAVHCSKHWYRFPVIPKY